jgi:hypothetical protein
MRIQRSIYRQLIGLYPPTFREAFGKEMLEVFEARVDAGKALTIWTRELLDLPFALAAAWSCEPARAEAAPAWDIVARLRMPIVALLALIVAATASDLVANRGLFHAGTLVILTALLFIFGGIGAVAFSLTDGRRFTVAMVAAASIFGAAIGGTVSIDRRLVAGREGTPIALSLPGVKLDALSAPSSEAARLFQSRFAERTTPRLRIDVASRGDQTVVTVVRSGGVDWLYGFTALLLLFAGGHLSWRRLQTA